MKTLKGILAVVAAVVVLASAVLSQAPKGPPQLKLSVTKEAPPKVDGVLDEAIWKTAAAFTDFKSPEGRAPKGKARLLVAQDEKTLYLAVECFEDEKALKTLVANATEHDDAEIWQDDEVEFFLDPTGKAESYYQIIINSKGVTWDVFHASPNDPDADWNPKYERAAKVGKASWVVEMALPRSIFDRTKAASDTWVFECLNVRQAGYPEELHFAPVEGSAHQPDLFGKLVGVLTGK